MEIPLLMNIKQDYLYEINNKITKEVKIMKIIIQEKIGNEKLVKLLLREFPEATAEAIELILYEWDLRNLNELEEEKIQNLLIDKQTKNKKYYLFTEPYYSLVCEKNMMDAKKVFAKLVCDIEDDNDVIVKEISLNDAKNEVEKSTSSWQEVFGASLMLIDGSL